MRPIVAHKWVILAVIVLAVGASVAYSKTQKRSYTATATVTIRSQNLDLSLVGLTTAPTETADQLAAAAAQMIAQRSVAQRVKHKLHSKESPAALTNSVDATVQPSSNLVEVTATAPTASGAKRLANAFGDEGARALNRQQRQAYAADANDLKRRAPKKTHPPTAAETMTQELYAQQLSRLQALSMIASPAQVVNRAVAPGSPSSPKPLRDGLLAAAFGLVLGLLIAYVRDSFDRRLRSAHDVEQEIGLPMLGHVRDAALGQSPRANGRQGAAAIDWELFRILRRNLDFLDDREAAQVVAVTSPLPEEGKSTVAAFLAFVSAAAGRRTLLLECDLRRPVLAERLGVKRGPGLSDFLAGQAKPAEILQVVKFGDPMGPNGNAPAMVNAANGEAQGTRVLDRPELHMHELVCITAGTPTRHPVELLRSDSLSQMLGELGQAYDFVVLDTAPMLSVVDTLELLPEVDATIVCVRMNKTTRQQARAGKAALNRLPERPTGVVITGTRPSRDAEYGYYGYYPYER